MDNIVFVILGPALVAGGIVAYRSAAWVAVRSFGAAATAAGAVMALIGWVNALSGTG